jgi:hypothetical protein
MQSNSHDMKTRSGLQTFVRNRYFYGKLLDVFHFELEQDYSNGKRWLLNRLITGYGVVCGLDVQPAEKVRGVKVTPGIAIDRAGREIVVPRASAPIEIPERPPKDPKQHSQGYCDNEEYVHLCICFQQCDSDPTPVLVDDCGQTESCSSSAIQERYKLITRDHKAPEIDLDCGVPDFIMNGRLNYYALVERVTRGCPELPADLCIPIANIRLTDGDEPLEVSDIDISPRPIVYSNDLLFDIILGLVDETPAYNRGGKQ